MSEVSKKSWYRPDIDGLRAIAVVAVILFHAQVPGFSGGYVGVDVFFVISGFLITSIIVRQLRQGTFSFLQFWERRIRRIVPVLFVVLLATAAVGYWLILFPLDYLDFGQSLFAQAFFLSNIFFLRKSDYFAGPAEASPLLHTWSLAIEEQFYLGFPLLLFILWKLGRRVTLYVLGLLLLASLVWSQFLVTNGSAAFSMPFLPPIWAAANNATAAFYVLSARAFELLIGVLLALLAVRPPTKWLAEVSAVAGLGFVLWSIVSYTAETAFPGFAALLPTIGTALLIFANTGYKTIVGKVISKPTMVFIGLLSYSLYLWHWPVLVLGKYWLGSEVLYATQVIALLALTLVLSLASYYVIENRFRTIRSQTNPLQVIFAGIGALAMLALVGYYIMTNNGLPERSPEAAQLIAAGATDFGPDRARCFVESRTCTFGTVEKPVTHVVLGDSHGGALLPAIAQAATNADIQVKTYLSPGCSPLTPQASQNPDSTCDQTHRAALATLGEGVVTEVLFVSRWSNWSATDLAEAEAIQLFEQQLRATVQDMSNQGVDVTILLQVPHHRYFETRQAFYQAVTVGSIPDYRLPLAEHLADQQAVNAVFQKLADEGLVDLIDPTELLCNEQTCDLVREGVMLYQDSNHLSQTGAMLLTPMIQGFLIRT